MCDLNNSHQTQCGCFFSRLRGNNDEEGREQAAEMAASPRRQPQSGTGARPREPPPMVVQGDFRKVSGISTEIFRQIETVENDHDATTAAALEAVERRGEMVVRLLDPRQMSRAAAEAAKKFLAMQDSKHTINFVEIVKRPGQTLGLYIREGNGVDRCDGVFISRVALESAVYNSGCLKVGDEILAVNLVDVTHMSLDDVVILMSIPRRLVLTTRQRKAQKGVPSPPLQRPEQKAPPVVVIKKELMEEDPQEESTSNGENGLIMGMPMMSQSHMHQPPAPPPGHPPPGRLPHGISHSPYQQLQHQQQQYREREVELGRLAPWRVPEEEPFLYYNSRPPADHRYRSSMGMTPDRPSGPHWYGGPEPSLAAYQPPPPVITEQPKPGTGVPQHFQPFERTYPKTLESLAEKVHTFYSGSRGGSGMRDPYAMRAMGMGVGVSMGVPGVGSSRSTTPVPSQPPMPSSRLLAGTPTTPRAERIRSGRTTPQHLPPRAESVLGAPPRAGRLLRSGSDQRLPRTEQADMYEYVLRPLRSSLKASSGTMQYPLGSSRYATLDHMQRYGSLRARPHHHHSRAAPVLDYASDTEATIPRHSYLAAASRAALGAGTGTPGAGMLRAYAGLRSNSLPRDHRGRTQRQMVRFEWETAGLATGIDSQEDSDGAVSAPELTSRSLRERGRIPSSPSVFTSEEYRSWLQRAPSTSAIYERIRQSRDVLQAQRAARFTYSAENLLDRSREDQPYYAYRPHLSSSTIERPVSRALRMEALSSGQSSATRRVRHLLEESRTIPNPSPTRSTDPRIRLLHINPAEFLKYKMDKATVGPSEEGLSGLLWIHLLAGRGLKPTTRAEQYRDLYCVVECDRVHKARTVIRTGDQNFDWDETFELDLVSNKELDFLIYSWDPQFRHKLCYKGSIHLVTLLQESPVHQLALKIEPRGTLYLKLRYLEPREAFRRATSPRKSALFGVDLETVVVREGAILTVPILLKRCLEEVERRGLDIIGLYRLCGSATKKKALREAFERNPRTVDLAPDNVPDINVITGVLKDYLRELPEPLVTKCLYQMLVDALGVCLADDPEGNAKLMFSILDCLPKANRNSFILLMDHLSLVASQSERNKMAPQNLAVCFGPVLMLQSEEEIRLDFQLAISVLKYLLEIWPNKSVRETESAPEAVPAQGGRGARGRFRGRGRRPNLLLQQQQSPKQSPGSASESSPSPPASRMPSREPPHRDLPPPKHPPPPPPPPPRRGVVVGAGPPPGAAPQPTSHPTITTPPTTPGLPPRPRTPPTAAPVVASVLVQPFQPVAVQQEEEEEEEEDEEDEEEDEEEEEEVASQEEQEHHGRRETGDGQEEKEEVKLEQVETKEGHQVAPPAQEMLQPEAIVVAEGSNMADI